MRAMARNKWIFGGFTRGGHPIAPLSPPSGVLLRCFGILGSHCLAIALLCTDFAPKILRTSPERCHGAMVRDGPTIARHCPAIAIVGRLIAIFAALIALFAAFFALVAAIFAPHCVVCKPTTIEIS